MGRSPMANFGVRTKLVRRLTHMAWFSKKKAQPGWMAISTDTDAIRLAHVDRPAQGKPRVDRWGIVQRGEGDGAQLLQAAEEYGLDRYHCATLLHPAQY